MKKIEATIRSSKIDEVTDALHAVGVDFFTYIHVKDISKQKPKEELYRGQVHQVRSLSRFVIEILAANQDVEKIVNAILSSAKTGEVGDGKIFVSDIEKAIRIRSGNEITSDNDE